MGFNNLCIYQLIAFQYQCVRFGAGLLGPTRPMGLSGPNIVEIQDYIAYIAIEFNIAKFVFVEPQHYSQIKILIWNAAYWNILVH